MSSETGLQSGRSALAARVSRSVPAGMVGGAVFGVGIRVAMRIAAIAEGEGTEFTIGGTVGIVMVGIIFGAAFGPVAVMVGRSWRRHPVAGAALAGAPLGLALVMLIGGSEIFELGNPMANFLTFGCSGAAFGSITAWRVERRRVESAARPGNGAIVIGTVAATALVSALMAPVTAWVLDRFDGGTRVHPALPTLRDPRVDGLADLIGGAFGALVGGIFIGLALAGILIVVRRYVVASGHPVVAIGILIAGVGLLTLLIPDGPRTTGNTVAVATGVVVTAVLVSIVSVRISRWFEPDVWDAITS